MKLPRPGEVLEGKYRLEEMLGEGAFGLVVKATTMSTNRPVAVKILKPSKDGYKDSRAQRFMRELRVIAKLQCPNTLTLYDFGKTEAGVLYMVTEFVEGEDLYDLLERRGQLTEKETMHILHQCLLSLSEAHEHGVLHRDIKPHNIRLTQYADDALRVKVLDFGLSKSMEDDDGGTLTAVGIAVGTPRYMSPEQLSGKELGPKSDIYSLGLVTYEMLIGEPATPLDSVVGPRRRIRLDEDSGVSENLRELVNYMLKRSRRERYATASEVLAALKLVRAGQPAPPPDPGAGFRPPAGSRSSTSTGTDLAGASYDALPRLATGETRSLIERQKEKTKVARDGPNLNLILATTGLVLGFGLIGILVYELFINTPPPETEHLGAPVGKKNPLAVPEKVPEPVVEPKVDAASPAPEVVAEGSCAGMRAYPPGAQTISAIAGLDRSEVTVYIPPDYDPSKPHPAIWFFHDITATPLTMFRSMKFDEVEDLNSFILIGTKTSNLTMWYSPQEFDGAMADLNIARETLCIDPARLYVWGQGFGGRVATRRAMCMDGIAAVATTNYRERITQRLCQREKTIPYLHVAATKDPGAPAGGGRGCYDDIIEWGCNCDATTPSIEFHDEFFKKRHGCKGDGRKPPSIGAKSCKTWQCETPYVSCTAEGGRALPDIPNQTRNTCSAAPAAKDFSYVRTVYEFFSQFEHTPDDE